MRPFVILLLMIFMTVSNASAAQLPAGFLGAFFRAQGTPPFGAFQSTSNTAPNPYPSPTGKLFGRTGYCDAVAANGVSIATGYPIDQNKLANIVDLGVKWARTGPSQFNDDATHIDQGYNWGDFDATQCALERYDITPVVNIEAGPVMYDSVPGTFSPAEQPIYQTPSDYGQWCGAVTKHVAAAFPNVSKFSIPGNEVDSNPQLFPGGVAQIAAYTEACYSAIKAANPKAFVYAFELNMDGAIDVPAFITQLVNAGCKLGTCYDGISLHLSLRYPIPKWSTPCYPSPGGDYGVQCIIKAATAANTFHVLVSETGYFVPGSVPDEKTKAQAVVDAMQTLASTYRVDGVNYANVDECDLYPSGYFGGGCLVDTNQNRLPAYTALQAIAR